MSSRSFTLNDCDKWKEYNPLSGKMLNPYARDGLVNACKFNPLDSSGRYNDMQNTNISSFITHVHKISKTK